MGEFSAPGHPMFLRAGAQQTLDFSSWLQAGKLALFLRPDKALHRYGLFI
jgi:hypothetical protein